MSIIEPPELPFKIVSLNCIDTGLLLVYLISLWEMYKTSMEWNLSPAVEVLYTKFRHKMQRKEERKAYSQFGRSSFQKSGWNSWVYIFV